METIYALIAEFLLLLNKGLIETPETIADEGAALLTILLTFIALAGLIAAARLELPRLGSSLLNFTKQLLVGALIGGTLGLAIDLTAIALSGAPLSSVSAVIRIFAGLAVGSAGSGLWIIGRYTWRKLSQQRGARRVIGKALSATGIGLASLFIVLLFLAVQFSQVHQLPLFPGFPDTYTSVEVFFGTDRKKEFIYSAPGSGRPGWFLTNARGKELTMGKAIVTVPIEHKTGAIEMPAKYAVFGATVYKETEDPKKHFTLSGYKLLTKESLIGEVNERITNARRFKRSALIFIHGYNTSFEMGLFRAAQLYYDLGFDGALFLYSWPARGGVEHYETDRNSSEQSQPFLREFIDLVVQRTDADQVHLIAHSMGNAPLLRVLREVSLANLGHAHKLRQIILAAPDVDRDIFEQLAEVVVRNSSVTLYATKNDRAMVASKLLGGGIPRAGDVTSEGPLVIERMDSIDASAVNTDLFGLNHSGYAQSPDLLSDIRALILCGLRPPTERSRAFEQIGSGKSVYWRLKSEGSLTWTKRDC